MRLDVWRGNGLRSSRGAAKAVSVVAVGLLLFLKIAYASVGFRGCSFEVATLKWYVRPRAASLLSCTGGPMCLRWSCDWR